MLEELALLLPLLVLFDIDEDEEDVGELEEAAGEEGGGEGLEQG